MGFFDRLGNVIRGFLSLFVEGLERRNPQAVLQDLQDKLKQAQIRFNTTTAKILAREKVAKQKLLDEERKLEEIRGMIREAKRQNDRDLALQLLVQEESQADSVASLQKQYEAIRAEAETARKDFENFQADAFQQMNRLQSLKNQADLKGLKDQMNELRSEYQTASGAGAIKARMDEVEGQIREGLAEAEAVTELGKANIETRMRDLKAGAARSRAEQRLKELFGESEEPATEGGRTVREKAPEA